MSTTTPKTLANLLKSARKEAGCASRDIASTKIPYSPETIGRHERGAALTPGELIIYADGYTKPDLLPRYCAYCPIGRRLRNSANDLPLPWAIVRLEQTLKKANEGMEKLKSIAFDGKVGEGERPTFNNFVEDLYTLSETVDDMILLALKEQKNIPSATAIANG